MAAPSLLTIGRLAERANVSTSMLRFYEREGLLRLLRRSGSGYRLYGADAENTLLFIRRSQRLGFSLDDIKLVLAGRGQKGVPGKTVVGIAKQRFLEIERRLTELLVLKLAFLALAIPGLATLCLAVAADVGTTVLVTLNGMRMLRAK
jgi:DNA-binding transcriptional MerR regulator